MTPWQSAVALSLLLAGAAADVQSQIGRAQEGPDGTRVLRKESETTSTEEGHPISAVVSDHGVKYVSISQHSRSGYSHKQLETAHNAAASHFEEARKGNLEAVAPDVTDATTTSDGTIRKEPNAVYFGVGLGTFLLALPLLAIGLSKFNYLEVPEVPLTQGNPQDEGEEDDAPVPVSVDPEHPGNKVKHRMQQVLVAWLFIVASIAFFLDYLALQAHLEKARHYFGMFAMVLWLLGFLIHFHWQISVEIVKLQLLASFFKVMACVMLQVHPFM